MRSITKIKILHSLTGLLFLLLLVAVPATTNAAPSTSSSDGLTPQCQDNSDPNCVGTYCKAHPSADGCVSGNLFQCGESSCDLVAKYVNPAVDLLSGLVGILAVISIILGGIQYSSAGGDPQKVAAARGRITKTIIGLVAYILLFAFLQFIVPGGVFNRTT